MICTLDGNGFCARHNRIHSGVERVYALEESVIGEGFRGAWDRENRTQKSEPPDSTRAKGLCRFMSEAPLDRAGCGSCQTKWVYPCELYGRCSPFGEHVGVKTCALCVHHTPVSLHAETETDGPDPDPRRLVLLNNCCPGDVLVMSAAIESLHRTYPGEFITAVAGTATELFDFNPHVVGAEFEIDGKPVDWETVEMAYPLIDECDSRPVHFMQGYCDWLAAKIGKPVPLSVNRPYLYLSSEERGWISQIEELTGGNPRYVVVNAGFKDDYPAKWWGTSNYQAVIDRLRGRVPFVQIGEQGHTHPPLQGVIDLRGKTDVRQLARLVYHAAGGLGPSTFLQHLCAALDKPYVCVAGGREPLAWQHYPRQATLSTIGVTGCSSSRAGRSCWKDRVTPDAGKPNATVCELPVISAGGEFVAACLESVRPERVAEEVWARYNVSGPKFS